MKSSTHRQKRARKRQNCQLGSESHSARSVTTIYGVRVCQSHADIINAMSLVETGHCVHSQTRRKAAA